LTLQLITKGNTFQIKGVSKKTEK